MLITDLFIGSITNSGIEDKEGGPKSRVLCDLGLYWPVYSLKLFARATMRNLALSITIDLFSLYILFSHFRPRDGLRTVSFKCRLMHVHPCPYVCIINEKTKGSFPGEHLVL